MNIDHFISCKIKELRNQFRLSQRELAHAIRVSPQQLQKYESGKNHLSAAKLYTLAEALQTSVVEFFPPQKIENSTTILHSSHLRDTLQHDITAINDTQILHALHVLLRAHK